MFPLLHPPSLADRKHRVCFFSRQLPGMPCRFFKNLHDNLGDIGDIAKNDNIAMQKKLTLRLLRHFLFNLLNL